MQTKDNSSDYNGSDRQVILRQSNIELLRIIAMVLIIAHHFSVHGEFEFPTETITVNRLWIQLIQMGGKIGVNVFVLISGYFLINAKSLKTSKIIKLWFQIFTYSTIIFMVFSIFGIEVFEIKELIKHCFPITFGQWWFASTYFVLYLLSPFINKMLNVFDKDMYQRFLVLLTICWCIIPTFTGQSFQSNELLWFIYLYSLAGYIKLFKPKIKIKGKTFGLLTFLMILLSWLSVVVFDILGTKILIFGTYATFFYDMQRLPILVISVFMLIGFSNIDIGYKRIINKVAPATFGVYLIHDDAYIRPFLWKTIFKNASYSESALLIPYSLIVIAIVFVVCVLIELIRINILEKYYIQPINAIASKIDVIKEKIFSNKIFSRI